MTDLVLVDAATAAVHLARIYDPGDPYDGVPVPATRLAQWAVRIRVWAHRFPTDIHRHRQAGRTLYDLHELTLVADRLAGLTLDQRGCNVP